MDTNDLTSSIGMSSRAAGVFATRIPSAVTLAVGMILFLLPFFEIAFANIFKMQNSGLGIAAGTDWDFTGIFGTIPGGSLHLEHHIGNYGPNFYAAIALALGTAAFTLSLFNLRKAQQIAMVFSIFTAALLIGCWIDLRQSTNLPAINSSQPNFNIRFQPTPWFYVAVIAFLVGAFFCYQRTRLWPIKN